MNRDWVLLRRRLGVCLLAALIILAYMAFPDALYDGAERTAYDTLVEVSPPIQKEERIVIIDLDERSLAQFGAWPWPRPLVARLVDELIDRHQVDLLGLDIVFPLRREGDSILRRALDRPNVVMSQTLDFAATSDNRTGRFVGDVTLDEANVDGKLHAPSATGYIANDAGVLPPNAAVGHISPLIDEDGRIRRLYPVACIERSCTMTLALRMYAQLAAAANQTPRVGFDDHDGQLQVDLSAGEQINLPVDTQRAWLVPYRVGEGGFVVVSAADVMDRARSLPALENSIALVGSSALGIGDRVATPRSRIAPGVEVHAQLIAALLDRSFIRPLPATASLFWVTAALLLLSYVFWPARGRAFMLGWPVVVLVVVTVWPAWLFISRGLLLPLTPLPLMAVVMGGLTTLQQNFELAARVHSFGLQVTQFLPASLVRRLLRDSRIGPETERHTMTVLIVDVRGFTAASEGKTPEQIAGFAQKCFEVLSAEVARYHGVIEKYTGDGLMALWGVPTDTGVPADQLECRLHVAPATKARSEGVDLPHARFAAQAVSAAIAMQRAVDQLADWFDEHGYAQLQLSIGLNTGPMSVGVFGGQTHLTWSAQGQAFNIASRIESLTRDVGESVLMGEETALLLAPYAVHKLGDYTVKGVSTTVAVYALKSY